MADNPNPPEKACCKPCDCCCHREPVYIPYPVAPWPQYPQTWPWWQTPWSITSITSNTTHDNAPNTTYIWN